MAIFAGIIAGIVLAMYAFCELLSVEAVPRDDVVDVLLSVLGVFIATVALADARQPKTRTCCGAPLN